MTHSLDLPAAENDGLPLWFDASAPWLTSIVFHLGIGLLVLFLAWCVAKATSYVGDPYPPVTVENPIEGPPDGNPKSGGNSALREPTRPTIRDLPGEWPSSVKAPPIDEVISRSAGDLFPSGTPLPHGGRAMTDLAGDPGGRIGGKGLGIGPGRDPGLFTPVGRPGGATRVVYIIDTSGSLLDNFDFLREEVKRSVGSLLPIQQFGVVAFSEEAQVLGPGSLQRALLETQRAVDRQIDALKAQGQNDGKLLPFQHAFEKAFAMQPQLIYFLTDGAFDPELFAVVKHLNVDHRVRINTLAFVNADADYEQQLKKLAQDNGGTYKFVSEKDLGR